MKSGFYIFCGLGGIVVVLLMLLVIVFVVDMIMIFECLKVMGFVLVVISGGFIIGLGVGGFIVYLGICVLFFVVVFLVFIGFILILIVLKELEKWILVVVEVKKGLFMDILRNLMFILLFVIILIFFFGL